MLRMSSHDEVLARLDASGAPAGSWVASDADGTLWSADAAELAWHALVGQGRIKAEAAPFLRGILERAGGRPDPGGDPHADAQQIFALYLRDQVDDWGILAAMTACYAGWTLPEVRAWASAVYAEHLAPRIYANTSELLRGIQERGYRLVVITGSPWFLVEQALELLDLAEAPPVLGVRLQTEGERLLDQVLEPVPWEAGKVAVWRQHAEALDQAGELTAAFGDTFGDLHLLEAAVHLRALVHPRPALRRAAQARSGPWCEFAPSHTRDGRAVVPPSTDRVLEV